LTLIAVTSCAKHAGRRAAVRETWVPHIRDADVRFFVGSGCSAGCAGDCIVLDCPDSYECLPQKTYRLIEYAESHGYTRLIKVDDDTFLSPRYVSELIGDHDCLAWVRHGARNAGIRYPQGGCYSLSRRAMLAVLKHPEMFRTGLEDGSVGRALQAEGIKLTHTDRVRPVRAMGHPKPDNTFISGHGFKPRDMRRIFNALKSPLSRGLWASWTLKI
jgi:hypothetical protein